MMSNSMRHAFLVSLIVCILVASRPEAAAQTGRVMPTERYRRAQTLLWRGDYLNAEKQFARALRSGVKTLQSRWIDSICYYAMLGETYYHQGRTAEALDQFNRACELYLAHSQWMLKVNYASVRKATPNIRRIAPWGRPRRVNVVYGDFPKTMSINLGEFLTEERVRQGGVVMKPQLWVVDVKEIVRCTALAIRRRNQLLGPLGAHDPLSARLAAQLRRGASPPNHWSSTWVDLEQGVADAGTGQLSEAVRRLSRATLVGGQYDHPLTATALIEQGRLAIRAGDLASAARLFEEAGYAAFYYEEIGAVDEALALGAAVHIISGGEGIYPPLDIAVAWANRKRWQHIQARLLLLKAEALTVRGQAAAADTILKGHLLRILSQRDYRGSRLETRFQYVSAATSYQLNRPKPAAASLRMALGSATTSGFWNFQISLLNNRVDAGVITSRTALDLYGTLLKEPDAVDWTGQPFESLSVLSTPHRDAFSRWLEAALAQKKTDRAVEICDAAKRHRFLSSLPLGGRLLALRTLLESSPQELRGAPALHRQDLLLRYPQYDKLRTESRALRRQLVAKPLESDDAGENRDRIKKLRKWENLSDQREDLLRTIALGRYPADNLFAPPFHLKATQHHLVPGDALVVFHARGDRLLGFLITHDQHLSWNIGPTERVAVAVSKALQAMGSRDPHRAVDGSILAGEEWRAASASLFELLFEDSRLAIDQTKQLIIVPDNVLWYVPFESLVTNASADAMPLIMQTRIRCVPLAALAVGVGRTKRADTRTGIVAGPLFPRAKDEEIDRVVADLVEAIPNSVTVPMKSPVSPRMYSGLVNQLILLGDVEADSAHPFAWSPFPTLSRRPNGSIAAWLRVPIGGPDSIVFPGCRTVAETGLRRRGSKPATGNELFVALCTFFARGTQTTLISRWRTGGQSSVDLLREFTQELPRMPATEAWQRSVLLAMDTPLVPHREPRVEVDDDTQLTAKHPFFWAGFLLADVGEPEEEMEEKPSP